MSYEKGRCHECGGFDDRIKAGRVRCAVCAAKDKERVMRRQKRLKNERRCITCGAQDARTLSGKTQCAPCARFSTAKARARYRSKKEAAAGDGNSHTAAKTKISN